MTRELRGPRDGGSRGKAKDAWILLSEVYPRALRLLMLGGNLSEDEAGDALHTAIVELFDQWKSSGPPREKWDWASYLATCAQHVLSRPPRRDARLLEFRPMAGEEDVDARPSSPASPPKAAADQEDLERIWDHLQQLTWRQHVAVLIGLIGGEATATASILGVSPGHARQLKYAGLRALRKMMGVIDSA